MDMTSALIRRNSAVFLSLALLASLSACSTGKVSFRGKPDAYAVVPRSALVTPPAGGGLPQPQAGSVYDKDADLTQEIARKAVLGDSQQVASIPVLQDNFGQYQNSDIRQVLQQEAEAKKSGPRNAIDNLLKPLRFNETSKVPGTPVDVTEEMRLLRSKGVATTTASFASNGHSLLLLQTGGERPFDPASLLNRKPSGR
jgi:hypothetical protein